MRKILGILLLFLAAGSVAEAQTKLYFRVSAASGLGDAATGYTGYGCNNLTGSSIRRIATTTAGSSVVSQTHTPTSTAPPCQMTNVSNYLWFFSAPLSADVTISGNIDFNISCSESNASLNAGMRVLVYRWKASLGGISEQTMTSADTAECNDSRLAIAAAAPTSVAFKAGDRLAFKIEIRNVGGSWGGNSSRTVTLKINAAATVLGDSFANFADTLSFGADVNNGRAIISWIPFPVLLAAFF